MGFKFFWSLSPRLAKHSLRKEKDPLSKHLLQGCIGVCQGVLHYSSTDFSEAELVQLLKNADNPVTSHLFKQLLNVIINKTMQIHFSSVIVWSNQPGQLWILNMFDITVQNPPVFEAILESKGAQRITRYSLKRLSSAFAGPDNNGG